MGKHMITIPSTFNYFDGLITVMEDPIEDVKELGWKATIDFSEKYKELTYTDEAFEKYKRDCVVRYTKQYGNPFDQFTLNNGIWSVKNPLYGKI